MNNKTIFANNYHLLLAIRWDLFKICHFVIQQWGWGWVIGWVSWYWQFSDLSFYSIWNSNQCKLLVNVAILKSIPWIFSKSRYIYIFGVQSLSVMKLKMLCAAPGVVASLVHCGRGEVGWVQRSENMEERVTQTKNWGKWIKMSVLCLSTLSVLYKQPHTTQYPRINDYICLTFHRKKIFCLKWSLI